MNNKESTQARSPALHEFKYKKSAQAGVPVPQKNLCSTSLWHFRKYCRICEKANTRSLRPTPTPARAKTARSGDPGSRADDCARSLYGRRDDEPWGRPEERRVGEVEKTRKPAGEGDWAPR